MLTQIDSPACIHCGCEDTEVLVEPKFIPAEWQTPGRAACNHCRREFRFLPGPQPVATLAAPPANSQLEAPRPSNLSRETGKARCPDCGSDQTAVYRTMAVRTGEPRTRYHRCHLCQGRFKTEM